MHLAIVLAREDESQLSTNRKNEESTIRPGCSGTEQGVSMCFSQFFNIVQWAEA